MSSDTTSAAALGRRRPFKVLDRLRTTKKGLMAGTLEELIRSGKEKLSYLAEQAVIVVLEEDGTEVDEEDYFQTLEENTELILLHSGERWSPFVSHDVTDSGDTPEASQRLISILLRLEAEPGTIALLSEAELELVCSVEDYYDCSNFPRYDKTFLEHLKKAAEKHLVEKGQIRDTLALLKIYHRANEKRESEKTGAGNDSNSRKKHKANK